MRSYVYRQIGRIFTSLYSTTTETALYEPIIVLRAWFCTFVIGSIRLLLQSFVPARLDQTRLVYIITSLTTIVQRCLAFQKDAPYIDLQSPQRDWIQYTPFSIAFLIYSPQLSFVSTYTLSSLSEGTGPSLKPQILTVTTILCDLPLVKQISQYFYSTNVALCLSIYSLYFQQASSSLLQFSSINILYMRMFVLSTNPITKVYVPQRNRRRVDIKKRNRIGDRVEPYRIPVFCSLFQSRNIPSLRHVVQPQRKDWIKFTRWIRKPFILRLQRSL